jgi:cell division septal protein FtsQ
LANFTVASAIFASLVAYPSQGRAQQTAEIPRLHVVPQVTAQAPARPALSKAVLATRFQDIKNQYTAIKATTAQFVPIKLNDSAELKLTRSRLGAAMYSYEIYEAYTQKQRDQLNLLTTMSEVESLRLQMAMDRLTKMLGNISELLKKMSANGDARI